MPITNSTHPQPRAPLAHPRISFAACCIWFIAENSRPVLYSHAGRDSFQRGQEIGCVGSPLEPAGGQVRCKVPWTAAG